MLSSWSMVLVYLFLGGFVAGFRLAEFVVDLDEVLARLESSIVEVAMRKHLLVDQRVFGQQAARQHLESINKL